uniref:Uncharacterized protein n=1 Tax=Branchiostoma floridae TaxID=7739 RepID=C3Y379_BRAFL|eukprot:XP_002609481.1 hypothetical protein BRAFLDRAFT_127005 [Branchiostoma floridae]
MAEGSRANVKTQLFVFNVVLWLAGGILFAVGLWLLYDPEITKVVSAELKLTWFYHACYAMVVAGAATLVVGCVGCYGAMKERKSLLMLFAILLFILFVLNMAAFIVGIMYRNKANEYTYDSFADALPRGYIEEQDYEFKEDVKKIESKFSCCGLRDLNQHGVPCLQDTCLCDPNVGEDCKDYSVFGSTCTVYSEPCLYKVSSFLRQKMIAVIVMPLIVALIQLFGICFVWRTQRNVDLQYARKDARNYFHSEVLMRVQHRLPMDNGTLYNQLQSLEAEALYRFRSQIGIKDVTGHFWDDLEVDMERTILSLLELNQMVVKGNIDEEDQQVATLNVESDCDDINPLGADGSQVSVSGLSAGACFATQYHVAHSAEVVGLGFIAGAPYWCAQGNLNTALGACMSSPAGITVSTLVSKTNSEPDIDDPSNMRGDRVWLFGGTRDTTVNLASDCINDCDYNSAYELLNHIYGSLVRPTPGSDVANRGELKTFDQNEFIDDSSSGLFNLPIVGKRQLMDSWLDYLQAGTNLYWDTVGAIADFWTGWMPDFGTGDIDISLPDWTSVLPGMGGGDTGGTDPGTDGTDPGTGGASSGTGGYSMDSEGYVYIPSGCRNPDAKCKVHVAFHGCKQGKNAIGDTYARHTGYLEVGELNNIIILFPQAVPDYMKGNPNGCFDWWGYEDANYATKSGHQISAVYAMVQRLLQ